MMDFRSPLSDRTNRGELNEWKSAKLFNEAPSCTIPLIDGSNVTVESPDPCSKYYEGGTKYIYTSSPQLNRTECYSHFASPSKQSIENNPKTPTNFDANCIGKTSMSSIPMIYGANVTVDSPDVFSKFYNCNSSSSPISRNSITIDRKSPHFMNDELIITDFNNDNVVKVATQKTMPKISPPLIKMMKQNPTNFVKIVKYIYPLRQNDDENISILCDQNINEKCCKQVSPCGVADLHFDWSPNKELTQSPCAEEIRPYNSCIDGFGPTATQQVIDDINMESSKDCGSYYQSEEVQVLSFSLPSSPAFDIPHKPTQPKKPTTSVFSRGRRVRLADTYTHTIEDNVSTGHKCNVHELTIKEDGVITPVTRMKAKRGLKSKFLDAREFYDQASIAEEDGSCDTLKFGHEVEAVKLASVSDLVDVDQLERCHPSLKVRISDLSTFGRHVRVTTSSRRRPKSKHVRSPFEAYVLEVIVEDEEAVLSFPPGWLTVSNPPPKKRRSRTSKNVVNFDQQ